jgi:hypothetical protein
MFRSWIVSERNLRTFNIKKIWVRGLDPHSKSKQKENKFMFLSLGVLVRRVGAYFGDRDSFVEGKNIKKYEIFL